MNNNSTTVVQIILVCLAIFVFGPAILIALFGPLTLILIVIFAPLLYLAFAKDDTPDPPDVN